MAWSLVAKVEYVVVEMVEKVVVEMGYLVEKEEEEEDGGGGVVVVVVVGMEEEMEEKEVVVLVVEMEGRVEKMAGQGKHHGCHSLAAGNKEEERKGNEREGKKGGGYIRGENIIIMLPLLIKETLRLLQNKKAASP